LNSLYAPADPNLEQAALKGLSSDVPWALIERFSTLVRESGSEDEWEAARYVCARLEEFGVPFQLHEPELFLSVPVSASVETEGQRLRAKAPSFSASTAAEGVTGKLLHVPRNPERNADFFAASVAELPDLTGKIVVTDGFGFPEAVRLFESHGAIGQVYVNPGEDIHWGTCTTIWGTPDLDSASRQPRTPVVAVNRPDGRGLIEAVERQEIEVALRTELNEGWFRCPLVVADVRGTDEPERFVLVHGHIDSWDVGIGDNAVGDATLLELARVFRQRRSDLRRSLKFAWWPGHSTGRYAGSTWFADTFALDLDRNCIAQVDIDSPGCRWATEYYDVSWMIEAEDFCVEAIADATGQAAAGERPHQAGDYSFNNIGITGFFMLLSTMPKALLEEKGFYPVGGCGGNIAWHTENDRLEVADRENLMRDLKVYVTTLCRVLNNPVHPFDFRKVSAEFRETLMRYSKGVDGEVDFSRAVAAVDGLHERLEGLHELSSSLADRPVSDPTVRQVNECLLRLGRNLIPINYTRNGRFRTEPAVPVPALPDVEPALRLASAQGHERRVLRTHVQRGLNRITSSVEEATRIVSELRASIGEESSA
jgi:N-acetylated-alpha-linked acidic dipeptidase